jgi:hypothetical protein
LVFALLMQMQNAIHLNIGRVYFKWEIGEGVGQQHPSHHSTRWNTAPPAVPVAYEEEKGAERKRKADSSLRLPNIQTTNANVLCREIV